LNTEREREREREKTTRVSNDSGYKDLLSQKEYKGDLRPESKKNPEEKSKEDGLQGHRGRQT